MAGLISAMAIALIYPALARPGDVIEPTANDLLRQAIANEKLNGREDYYAWMDRVQKPRGSITKLMVNTPQGILSRIVAYNDRALTPDERQQDDGRIDRLLDPALMRDKAKKQHEDQQHIERVLFALPDAMHCEYTAAHDDHNLSMECSPNPGFSAPNYESQVLQGMKTTILINRQDKRIASLQGTLFKDVNFGWGVLAKLNRGGNIEITRSKVAGKHWCVTRLQLKFDGRVIVFKALKLEETETSWDYRSVPRMTVAQALEYLRNPPSESIH
jgi:uncharacterized protein YjhX (UPF0386 family)